MTDSRMNKQINFDLGEGTVVVITSGLAFGGGPSVPKPPPRKTGRVIFYLRPEEGPVTEEYRLDIEVEVQYQPLKA